MNLQTQLNRLGELGNVLEIFVGSPWHLSATLLSEKPDYVLILRGVWRNGSSQDELIKEVLSQAFFAFNPNVLFLYEPTTFILFIHSNLINENNKVLNASTVHIHKTWAGAHAVLLKHMKQQCCSSIQIWLILNADRVEKISLER